MNPHPHDTLIRAIFGQPGHAADELRAILPASLTSRLDLAALARVEASFVDPALRATSADLLFTVPWIGGGQSFVYFLLEHQSTFDRRMPLRLLGYMTRIWERRSAQQRDDAPLPPIVPVVLHQGTRPWRGSRRFADHLRLDAVQRELLGPALLDFEFVLDDLAAQSDHQLLARAMGAIGKLALIALKNARPRPLLATRFAAVLRELRHDLRGPGVVPALAQLVSYVLEAGEGDAAEVRGTLVQALAPEVRSDVMVSTADLIRAEGRLEARRESLTELVEARFGAIKPAHRRAIASASLAQLIAWIRRAALAPTAREIFRK